ncbi:MAG: hypothetical protein Q8R40_05390, partial [bacterium]|nr:hypothetical protein [bacterium]MDZ4296620.1 hypothetical protein [Patescibacteria group bacterium]
TMASKEDVQHLEERIDGIEQKMDGRFAQVDSRLAQLDLNVQHVTETVNLIHHDTADLPALRQEIDDLRTRVARLEARLGMT